MSKSVLLLKKCFVLGLIFSWIASCSFDDKIIETKHVDGMTIIKTENLKLKKIVLDFIDENQKKIATHYYESGFSICDTNMSYRGKINEYPDKIELYDGHDSLVAIIECMKISDSAPVENGRKYIYDCNRLDYNLNRRTKVNSMDYLPGVTQKAVKRNAHFRINQNCNGTEMIFISESIYDFDHEIIKEINYNQNGKIESISYYDYPQRRIYEKKLYIDGEYIKTKCFLKDSLNAKKNEFIDENKSCLE